MKSAIRVAIADDQKLFCSGIQMLIESQLDLEFVGAAYDGEAIVELALSQKADIVLMDIRMPIANGITATEIIRAKALGDAPKIIILTTHERDVAVLQAINAGASGFLLKDANPAFLLEAIRTVHGGQSVIAPRDSVAVIKDLIPTESKRADYAAISHLSAREKEIFLLAARGLSNSDIATTAFISETTVKSHVSNILSKLTLSSRLQIVAFAYENGLLR
ncbi:DNA-binding response regulator, NarL/FixJ family, contains REC and HTH domains [Cryobacterium flavum]|uniref:DNA-binding response regulator, NarL/FixJ family, contains REC and HTH domains n=1 Tax=Cryobacterium flavum TaxID=1424659 RepID=A0A4R8VI28_9MICO|nr:response regulator transcription factor [Cryobacterium flavum]TFB82396.1 response regulator transcription factor [Cryobacterium flavum]SDO50594.1 DNA-binding response regulator, NarL/FixJ family, contains REC and HTH domains [Cryobacterium flavum]